MIYEILREHTVHAIFLIEVGMIFGLAVSEAARAFGRWLGRRYARRHDR